MRCKNIQRLILDMSGEDRSDGPPDAVKRHIADCPECERFLAEVERMRTGLENRPLPPIPRDLDVRTKEKCLSVLSGAEASGVEINDRPLPASLPKPVWAALFAITALTFVLTIPLIKNFKPNEPLTLQTAAIVALMTQNAVMLLFTPILMRKIRPGLSGSRIDRP